MLQRTKSILWVVLIIVVVGGIGYFVGRDTEVEVLYQTATVRSQDLSQTVQVTGSVTSQDEVSLQFATAGRVAEIPARVGVLVEEGDVLLRLDDVSQKAQLVEAESNVLEMQAVYESVLSGTTGEEIAVGEANVEKKKVSLRAAENDVISIRGEQDSEIADIVAILKIRMDTAMDDALNLLDGVYDQLLSEDVRNDFDVSNTIVYQILEQEHAAVAGKFGSVDASAQSVASNTIPGEVSPAADEVLVYIKEVGTVADRALAAANSIVVSSTYTVAKIDAIEADIVKLQGTLNTDTINLQTQIGKLSTRSAYYQTQIQKAEDAVRNAREDVRVAEADLALTKADPLSSDLKKAQANVTQARAAVDVARDALNKTVLLAPGDGLVTHIGPSAGEWVSTTDVVVMLISPDLFVVDLDIPEADISKITVGDGADVIFDAFRDMVFDGTVQFVDPAETVISDVVYYQAEVGFADDEGVVKSGMTAEVTIATDARSEVLTVPQRALRSRGVGDRYVEILVGEDVIERDIQVGIIADGGFAEIISGLVEGDVVITSRRSE